MKFFRLLPVVSLAGISIASAQQGSFDAQLSLKSMDCAAGKVEVQVQVRAHEGLSFDMGDANYRFEYNSQSLKNPQIISQDNFSSQSSKRDLNYGQHNLQGSREVLDKGIVSLNTFYTGANQGSQKVTTEWTPVSTLRFDLANFKTPIELTWHDDKTFPISGMNQVKITEKNDLAFEYDLSGVGASGLFGNLRINPAASCRTASPTVAAAPLFTRKNQIIEANFPIFDSDEIDSYTTQVISIGHGVVTPSVKDRVLALAYKPNPDFMGQDEAVIALTDRFGNCEKVAVKILVKDNALMVFNGFSPNNDGKNDFFTVDGIEEYANNILTIFDSRGHELFQKKGYKNDWDGKTEGRMILDGTYFYTIDDGEGQTYTGYLQVVH